MVRDLIIIGAIGLPLYLLAVWWDALDKFLVFTGEPQSDAVDWLVILFVFLGVAAKIYSVRRTVDLRREVVARRKAQAEAHQMARLDVLTGLPNRRWFIEDFEKWSGDFPPGEACALFVLDLDNFKPINDVYGHRLGDEVLTSSASSCPTVRGPTRLNAWRAASCMSSRAPSASPLFRSKSAPVSASRPATATVVAISGSPTPWPSPMALLSRPCCAGPGRGRYRFFDRSMDERLRQRVELETEIKHAIAAGQIVPYYQRIVRLDDGETLGFEALARWVHPTWGVLLSETFIPIAEDTGTISAMTDHLLERVMRDAKDWPEHLSVSVNFSPRQVSDPHLATRILGLLAKAAFPPHRLVIEITEGAVVQRLDDAKAVLQSLRNVGVRIALDDFGTGYSGLYHLRELELDMIKIDRSFIAEIVNKPEEARIVKAMLSLGRALGVLTIAEGIESDAVRECRLKLGCDAGQGYLFGSPEPAAMVKSALAANKAGTPSRQIA